MSFLFFREVHFNIMHVLSRLCFHHWLSFPVVDGFFIINNFKLVHVVKNNCYAVHVSSPTHAYMHAVHTSPAHTCLWTCTAIIIIWQVQNCEPTLAYRSSKTPDKINKINYVFSVIDTARRYSSWCLVTCANLQVKFPLLYLSCVLSIMILIIMKIF